MGIEQIASWRILSRWENALVNKAQVCKIETLVYEEVIAVEI